MQDGNYLKLIGLELDGFEARIIEDKNVKDFESIPQNISDGHRNAIWLIFPCSYRIS